MIEERFYCWGRKLPDYLYGWSRFLAFSPLFTKFTLKTGGAKPYLSATNSCASPM